MKQSKHLPTEAWIMKIYKVECIHNEITFNYKEKCNLMSNGWI